MMKMLVIAAMAIGTLAITGCEEKSPAEQLKADAAAVAKDANKAASQAAKDMNKAANQAAADIKKAAK